MDWGKAIEHQRQALLAIVVSLFDMLELAGDAVLVRLPPHLHRAVLRVLRPAEAAVRRLVVIAARGVVVKPSPPRPMPSMLPAGRRNGNRRAFRLFDPPERAAIPGQGRRWTGIAAAAGPRIHVFGPDPRIVALWPASRPPVPAPLPADGSVDATRLSHRLHAIRRALDNLPYQARRLARLRLRRQTRPGPKPATPLRFGQPPGFRRRPSHEVDRILAECHHLARLAVSSDTS
jgi:hypothetical protein